MATTTTRRARPRTRTADQARAAVILAAVRRFYAHDAVGYTLTSEGVALTDKVAADPAAARR